MFSADDQAKVDPFSFSRQSLQTPSLCALRLLKTSPATHSDAIATPPLDGAPKQYSPKIQQLVNDIASLTLLEVSDLNELLKVCGKSVCTTEYLNLGCYYAEQ